MTFEEKILKHVYPSKEEFLQLHNDNYSRAEICEHFHFSASTYKKIRRYYNIPEKTHKFEYSEESYRKRMEKTQKTLNEKYGEKGSEERKKFNEENRKKAQKTNLERYGVLDYSISGESKNKRKETLMKRYGVDNPMKSSVIQQKARETDLKKYGTPYHISSKEVAEKALKTISNRYGSRSEMAKQNGWKREETNLKKYGVKHIFNTPDFSFKSHMTMYENGVEIPASRQQRKINNLLQGILNYPMGPYHIDCFVKEDNVVVEYSGSGHDLAVRLGQESEKHFMGKEKARQSYFRNKKIPYLEFVSKKDKLPEDDKILFYYYMAKEEFKKGEKLYCCVNLDTEEVSYK